MKVLAICLTVLFSFSAFAITEEDCRPENFSSRTESFSKVIEGSKIKGASAMGYIAGLHGATRSVSADRFGRSHMVSFTKKSREVGQDSGMECSWYKATQVTIYCAYNTKAKFKTAQCAKFCGFRVAWEDCR